MRLRLTAVTALLAISLTAACGGGSSSSSGGEPGGSTSSISGSISVMGVWSGPEQAAFQKVIDGFTQANPGVTVKYTSAGDQLPTQLSTAVEGGNPPSVAFVAQPGLIADFVKKGAVKPIEYAASSEKTAPRSR